VDRGDPLPRRLPRRADQRLTETIGEQIAAFEAAVELLRTIPGVQRRTAATIVAEIGVDMSVFPEAKQLASWAGRCPGNDQSAGKRRSGTTRKGSKRLDWALEEAALAATRSKDSYLAAYRAALNAASLSRWLANRLLRRASVVYTYPPRAATSAWKGSVPDGSDTTFIMPIAPSSIRVVHICTPQERRRRDAGRRHNARPCQRLRANHGGLCP